MADESNDQEKTEPATPRRLQKAREEGQAVRSRELTTWLLLLSGITVLWAMGTVLYGQLGLVMEQAFLFERDQVFDTQSMLQHIYAMGERVLFSCLPLFLVMVIVALAAPTVLGGWLMSAKSLQPKFSKLNPVKGLKRIFSSQALAELVKVLAKALLVAGVAAWFLWQHIREFMAMMDQAINQALAYALTQAALVCGLMTLALIVVVLIDVPYQLWSHARKMRMSKEEVRREHKESEGDPQIKSKIRQQQQELARRRMMSRVPEADVIVTNPTHYAVALKYEAQSMAAPRVVAKGSNRVAQAIRELGEAHQIPLLEAPPLARALYAHVDLEQEISAALYAAVAEVLAWAFSVKQARHDGSSVPPAPADIPVPCELQQRHLRTLESTGGAAQV